MNQSEILANGIRSCEPNMLLNRAKTRALLLDTIQDKQIRSVMISLLEYGIPTLLIPIANNDDITTQIEKICNNLTAKTSYNASLIRKALAIWVRALRTKRTSANQPKKISHYIEEPSSTPSKATTHNNQRQQVQADSDTMRFNTWNEYVYADRAGEIPDNIKRVLLAEGQMGSPEIVARYPTVKDFHNNKDDEDFELYPDVIHTIHILWDDFAGERNNLLTIEERNNALIQEIASSFKQCKK